MDTKTIIEMGNYTYERFTEFTNRVIDQLSHVKRVNDETGEVYEELWDNEEIDFEEYGIDYVEDAITVDYDYDYDDDDDLAGCRNEDGETLADVYGFKIHDGHLYVNSSFYAGHGTSSSDWDRLTYGSLYRPIVLEKAILETLERALERRWRWDVEFCIIEILDDPERGCSEIVRTRPFAMPEGCIVPLGDGIPLLNGKVATALKSGFYPNGISICTRPVEGSPATEDYAISPDDPGETIPDFIGKVIGLLENPKNRWVVIIPDKNVELGNLNIWCFGFRDGGFMFDALIIQDKDTVINDKDLDMVHFVFKSLHIPHGFIIPENAGLDPGVVVIEDPE